MTRKLTSKKQVLGQVAKRTLLDLFTAGLLEWVFVENNSGVKKRRIRRAKNKPKGKKA